MNLRNIFLPILLMTSALTSAQKPLINFEETSQDFVLETKRIQIPGYDTAFNPSIIRLNDKILMCFRIRDPITKLTHQIGFVWLDQNFNLISAPQLLEIENENPYHPPYLQDSRLITSGGRLYIVYNNIIGPVSREMRRMFIAELRQVNGRFIITHSYALLKFPGANDKPREKNWVPFDYHGCLLLSYSIFPHTVFYPLPGTHACETFSSTDAELSWKWGEIRGGTQAFLEGHEYLSFFHSAKDMRSAHSPKDKISHYFIGAYTFAAHPPFNITQMSPEPIVGKDFYHGNTYKTWKPLRVVFPGGYISDQKNIWIAYGKQDHEIWIVKLDKQGLLNSLVPVKNKW